MYVKSGQTYSFNAEYEEVMNENDWTFYHSGTPTKCATVTVYAPPEFDISVVFDHRASSNTLVQVGPNVWQLNAILLPHQNIRIIWRKKKVP